MKGFGLAGEAREIGVYGATRGQGIGVYGRGDLGDDYAGFFVGNTVVIHDFTVFFGHHRIGVRHPDQPHRALYSIASPECWFQDFGRAKLIRGKAMVRLDRDFAAVVRTKDYHVFLTAEGNCNVLYVTNRNRVSFVVREQLSGESNVQFSCQIVARRKDLRAVRFARAKFPNMPYFKRT
jgi:hypothetical protein